MQVVTNALEELAASIFYLEERGSRYHRNVYNFLLDYSVPQSMENYGPIIE